MDIKLATGHIWGIADGEPMNPESNPDLRKEERILKEIPLLTQLKMQSLKLVC